MMFLIIKKVKIWEYILSNLMKRISFGQSGPNLLCVNLANRITVTFEKSLKRFPYYKTVWIGNPVRHDIDNVDKNRAIQVYGIKLELALVLVMGGGTGAMGLNTITNQALESLVKFCQIVLITGVGKKVSGFEHENFQQFEFIKNDIPSLISLSSLVVCRAGMSTLTELSVLAKPCIDR